MDEDVILQDDLKADSSDRHPMRTHKLFSQAPKLAASRQYLMIGMGIFVLLLLILGIGSALKSPQSNANQVKERVDLPGNITDALAQQQGCVDSVAQDSINAVAQSITFLPMAPATVDSSIKAGEAPVATYLARRSPEKQLAIRPRSELHAASLKSAPGSHFTLQLSGALRSNTLNNFARQHGLKNYLVYQTNREGKPWFVLVSGNYATSVEAKRAIASLPAEVKAKQPWVKPVHQVQQDLKK